MVTFMLPNRVPAPMAKLRAGCGTDTSRKAAVA